MGQLAIGAARSPGNSPVHARSGGGELLSVDQFAGSSGQNGNSVSAGMSVHLAHIAQIPAMEMQNLADMLKPLGFGIMGNLVQHVATPLEELTSGWHVYVRYGTETFAGLLLDQPLAMLFDVLGAPILAMRALQDSLQSTFNALIGGHPLNAMLDLVTTPTNILHAFLFGQGYLVFDRFASLGGNYMQGAVHLGGLFAPLDYGESSLSGYYPLTVVTDPRYGTLTGGLVPAFVSMLPPFPQKPSRHTTN